MLRRRMMQAGITIAMAATSILGLGSAANASPTSFNAKYVHANGAGAVGVQAIGGITWHNRSVSLTSVRFYTRAGECGTLAVHAYQGLKWVGSHRLPSEHGMYCGGTYGWFDIGNIVLDGSSYPGGITDFKVVVHDRDHDGIGYAYCYRSYLACY